MSMLISEEDLQQLVITLIPKGGYKLKGFDANLRMYVEVTSKCIF